jgi:hypothetical protein
VLEAPPAVAVEEDLQPLRQHAHTVACVG